jgi:hypothetical protein
LTPIKTHQLNSLQLLVFSTVDRRDLARGDLYTVPQRRLPSPSNRRDPMNDDLTALTFDELATAKAAIRVIRYLTVIATGIAVPMLLVLATPLFGWALLTAIVASPLLLAYVVAAASRQAKLERRTAP